MKPIRLPALVGLCTATLCIGVGVTIAAVKTGLLKFESAATNEVPEHRLESTGPATSAPATPPPSPSPLLCYLEEARVSPDTVGATEACTLQVTVENTSKDRIEGLYCELWLGTTMGAPADRTSVIVYTEVRRDLGTLFATSKQTFLLSLDVSARDHSGTYYFGGPHFVNWRFGWSGGGSKVYGSARAMVTIRTVVDLAFLDNAGALKFNDYDTNRWMELWSPIRVYDRGTAKAKSGWKVTLFAVDDLGTEINCGELRPQDMTPFGDSGQIFKATGVFPRPSGLEQSKHYRIKAVVQTAPGEEDVNLRNNSIWLTK